MHFYRLCLILLHICSTLCYIPYLISHVIHISSHSGSFQSKLAFIIYWFNYCLLISGILSWCLYIICQKQTIWQVIQNSGLLLIAKLIYTIFDVITRILLYHKFIIIISDIIHIIILFPAIIITFLLVENVKRKNNYDK